MAELRQIDPVAGAPRGGRKPLREPDAVSRAAIESARDVIDGATATAAWERALKAPAWDGMPVWIHCDLLRPNLLVAGGHPPAAARAFGPRRELTPGERTIPCGDAVAGEGAGGVDLVGEDSGLDAGVGVHEAPDLVG